MDVEELAAALQDSIGLLARRLRQTSTPGELTLPERSALSRLDRGGSATSAELARAEQITPQAMATTISGLEQRGLVERRNDPHDGRRIIMSLSESGREVLRRKRAAHAQQLAAALAAFSGDELDVLAAAAPLIERMAEGI
ncbi:MarR family winged helix-turn-helix transcriptional regulator [Kutzneria sp. CA-103260]|uniref:MarR family winged helix-turn-helix transcriptional regulator n=1 Tax=Kutzneria sp. CA-103260 TaxID=2802641 RepID=UPI001BAB48DA|nr:MarR family transcriptional regulator [Kutzneria sp. CA-103260]QUQ66954.1 MarR family transcriptional regulator [Kutzneria sp. CA-103260]